MRSTSRGAEPPAAATNALAEPPNTASPLGTCPAASPGVGWDEVGVASSSIRCKRRGASRQRGAEARIPAGSGRPVGNQDLPAPPSCRAHPQKPFQPRGQPVPLPGNAPAPPSGLACCLLPRAATARPRQSCRPGGCSPGMPGPATRTPAVSQVAGEASRSTRADRGVSAPPGRHPVTPATPATLPPPPPRRQPSHRRPPAGTPRP